MKARAKSIGGLEQLANRSRVIGALIIREIYTRFGRANMGFIWVFFEPFLFVFLIVAFRSALESRLAVEATGVHSAVPLIPFLISGYAPFLLFRNTATMFINCLRSNVALLYHRQIQSLDMFVARISIEFCGSYSAFWVLTLASWFFGFSNLPYDPLLVNIGYLYMLWLSFGFGLCLTAVCMANKLAEKVWSIMSYLTIIISGAFYLANWLPPGVRDIVILVNPLLNSVEIIREGFFGPKVQTWYNLEILTVTCLIFTFVGLLLLPYSRKKAALE